MLPPEPDYTDKRILLIESSGNMRATIVHMLRQLGVANIQAITANDQAIELLKEEFFDIVLIGHNSSGAHSGAQILEESRYLGLIKPGSCWVFMTGEPSQEIILHAIDSRPDAVITKPFTMEELKSRLDLLVYRKTAMKEVDEAIENGQLNLAVRLCDQVELSGVNYDHVQLIKGRLLLQLNRFEEAEHFFKYRFSHLREKESGLCLAEAYVGEAHFAKARELLFKLIDKYPLQMAAYDLLAQVLEQEGDLVPAQDTLKLATTLSPMSFLRHMELGRIAVYNHSIQVADAAYRKSVTLSDTSCYRSAEPLLRLANVKRLAMQGAGVKEQLMLRNEFETLLNTARFKYPDDITSKVQSLLLKSQLSRDFGEEKDTERYMHEAAEQAENSNAALDLNRELLNITGDRLPLLETDKRIQLENRSKQFDPVMSARANRMGIKHYMLDKIPQAMRYFGLAIEHDPKNRQALINLAQLFLESAYRQSSRREERIKMVQRYLNLAQRMSLSDVEQEKAERLRVHLDSVNMAGSVTVNLGPLLK